MTRFVQDPVKMCEKMVGHSNVSPKRIILTPILSLYQAFLSKVQSYVKHTDCFYENAVFKSDSDEECMIICIPQGLQSQDIMYILQEKEIFFFGFAGSLTPSIPVGSIVEVQRAISPDGDSCILTDKTTFQKVTVGYSPCMVGKIAENHTAIAVKLHCDAVDMETTYCAMLASMHHNLFSSVLLITDIPGSSFFWNLKEHESAALEKGYGELIDFFLKIIANEVFVI